VYAGSFDDDHDPSLAYDVDVYANRLARVGDDGFEPEGAAVNARFWGNAVDVVHNGVSLAPITYGPVWVVRNRFAQFDLDYDSLYTTRGAPRLKWNDVRYDDVAAMCAATGLECHGLGAEPALTNPGANQLAPSNQSPLVDRALRIYGINDAYHGAAPDIGYVESGDSELPAL
jgi:hypothetical protein